MVGTEECLIWCRFQAPVCTTLNIHSLNRCRPEFRVWNWSWVCFKHFTEKIKSILVYFCYYLLECNSVHIWHTVAFLTEVYVRSSPLCSGNKTRLWRPTLRPKKTFRIASWVKSDILSILKIRYVDFIRKLRSGRYLRKGFSHGFGRWKRIFKSALPFWTQRSDTFHARKPSVTAYTVFKRNSTIIKMYSSNEKQLKY